MRQPICGGAQLPRGNVGELMLGLCGGAIINEAGALAGPALPD
jgi:hypothetical protein